MTRKKDIPALPLPLVLIVFILFLLISVLGYFFYEYQQRQVRAAKEHELLAIANLKVDEIGRWRKERLADGQVIAGNPLLAPSLSAFIREPRNDALKEELLRWMKALKDSYDYHDVLLLDTSGSLRLSARGETERLSSAEKTLAARALQEKKILFSDFFRDETEKEKILLSVIVPLFMEDGAAPLAVMILEIDPTRFLYPLIQTWPTPSPSSETLLIRRDGAEVVFLNELRHRKNTPLFLRAPVESRDLLAAKAARGREGGMEGADYRGIPVIGVSEKIRDTSWWLIAKTDREEILKPLENRARITFLLALLAMAAAGLGAAFFGSRQQAAFYKKQYETELERQALAKHFEYLIKYANDMILLMDEDLKICEVNDRACEVYGYSREEMLGMNLRELCSSRLESGYQSFKGNAESYDGILFDAFNRKKDGMEFPVEISARFIEVEGKTFYQNIIRDITERKKAEEALRETKDYLENLINHANAPIIVWNRESIVTRFNQAFERLTGYSSGEVAGRKLDMLFPEVSRDYSMKEIGETAKGSRWETVEIPILCKDGTIRLLLWNSANILTEDGKAILATIAQGMDITERKKAADALRQSEGEMKMLLGSMINAFVIFDSVFDANGRFVSYRFVYINEAYEKITGVRNQEVRGKTVHEVWPGTEASWVRAYGEVAMTGKASSFEMFHAPTRKTYFCQVYRPYPTNEKFCVIFEDITERKRLEEELIKHRDHLEELVRTRSAELKKANETLTVAYDEMKAFSYSVSHDLRTPLRAIDGFSRMLEKNCSGQFDEEARRLFGVIGTNVKLMNELIEGLLDLASLEYQVKDSGPVDMTEIAREVAEELKPEIAGRDLRIVVGMLPPAAGNARLLHQVFLNLIANAVKFTRKKPAAAIEISGWTRDGENVYCVKDNGAGFDMQYANKLFGIFQRLHSLSDFEGTGIGLALVQRVVLRHGGRVWAEGKVGEGAAFYFALPIKNEARS